MDDLTGTQDNNTNNTPATPASVDPNGAPIVEPTQEQTATPVAPPVEPATAPEPISIVPTDPPLGSPTPEPTIAPPEAEGTVSAPPLAETPPIEGIVAPTGPVAEASEAPQPENIIEEQPAPATAPNPEEQLNIPPEIAAAKANIQTAENAQAQPLAGATLAKKPFPLKMVLIIVGAVVIIVGGYFAYRYFTGSKTSTENQMFIPE